MPAAVKMELEMTCGVCWRSLTTQCHLVSIISAGEFFTSRPCSREKEVEGSCADCSDGALLVSLHFVLQKHARCQLWSVCEGKAASASFLAARVLPVDSYKIRNSLFLSVSVSSLYVK
jgi:hypothetical protein